MLVACQKGNLDNLEQQTALSALNIQSIEIEVNEIYLPVSNTSSIPNNPFGMPINKTLQVHLIGVIQGSVRTDITSQVDANWTISSDNGSKVSNAGLITSGASVGSLQINASYAGLNTGPLDIAVYDDATPNGMEIWQSTSETLSNDHSAAISVNLCDQVTFEAYYVYGANRWPATNAVLSWGVAASGTASKTNMAKGVFYTNETSLMDFTVTVSDGNIQASRNLTGTGATPISLRIAPNSFDAIIGENKTLAAYASYPSGDKYVPLAATWTWSPAASATMTNNVFNGSVAGNVQVTATCAGVATIASAKVADNAVIRLVIENTPTDTNTFIQIGKGGNLQLNLTAYFSSGDPDPQYASNSSVDWTIQSGTDLLAISSTGLVTPNDKGNVGYAVVRASIKGSNPLIYVDITIQVI